jgi:hypothetical protein
VAYATQMAGSTAVTRGTRHQGSVRNVRPGICARVLAGASVIVSASSPPHRHAVPVTGNPATAAHC